MPAPRSKRYDSEYISHYKKFEARRPNTVKGEVTRSLSYDNLHSNGSTPRAGLLSSQLGTTLEPPLQRKRIVPYEKNHNIFTTLTVKEEPDREWLKSNGKSDRSCSPNKGHKEEKSAKASRDSVVNRSETPILAAERKIFKDQHETRKQPVYVPDRIHRKSTYKKDFVDYKKQSKTKPKSKPKRQQSPHKVVGGEKGGTSPDRLPPAGIRRATSIGDTRLLKPSDDSQYLRSPEREQKVFNSEYSSRFTQPTKFKYVDGLWIETPVKAEATYNVMDEKKRKSDWYTQVLQRRKEAYGHAHHARGTHFSRESLDEMNREHAERESSRSESQRSLSPAEEKSRDRKGQPRSRTRSESPPRRREAWTEVRSRSPRESEDRRAGSGTEATSDDEDMVLERGRSPTPELRDARLSRRHHLDVTTNILNDSFEKSLSLSKKKKPSRSHGRGTPPREEREIRPSSPASSVGLGDDARTYTPPRQGIPRKVEISPPDPRRVSPPGSVGGSGGGRDDDVLSVSAMSSRASTASETLQRARKRRDEFWKQENASR
ncbi:hypothetical protein ACROYT_G018357 [Oculina patagonica]